MRRCSAKIEAMWLLAMWLLLASCSSAKHVPVGSYLLESASVHVEPLPEGDSIHGTMHAPTGEMLRPFLRQTPNHKILWIMKLQLGIYNMSGNDTTRWWNRWLRRMGEAPVIYDDRLTAAGAEQLGRALENMGYLGASVTVDTTLDVRKRKARVDYHVSPGLPHYISTVEVVQEQVEGNEDFTNEIDETIRSLIVEGDALDRNVLDQVRDQVARIFRNHGHYGYGKENITFVADTTEGSLATELTVRVSRGTEGSGILPIRVGRVVVVTDYDAVTADGLQNLSANDTIDYKGLEILYDGRKPVLRPSMLRDNIHLCSGELYKEKDVSRTYEAFARLGILKFVNVRLIPGQQQGCMDAYVLLTPDKSQSVTFEVEGTNSEGDLGAAVGLSYTHRNVGRGSETLTAKLRGAYEAIGGKPEGVIHNRYLEFSGDVGVDFPKFKFPFLHDSFKRKIRASTVLNVSMNYQERPEYTRIISTAGWAYRWLERPNGNRHTWTVVDINYVYLPQSTNDFINQIAPDNPLLRYSYEDHFIMRMGYSFYRSNKPRIDNASPAARLRLASNPYSFYTLRVKAETAGNLLFAINSIFTHRSDYRENPYKIFGIHYSQYVKAEADFVWVRNFDARQSLALHAGAGFAVPYGNSTVVPFEKRFYGGGANGVRGWAVRTLGPGSFKGSNSVRDFMDQCGDIRLDLSAEYRARLFWVIELGLFVDAGNIWTIRSYENQPGGEFRFNSFYKQIAAAYGVGIRLDFNYFLLRFDLGMKAHNPATGEEPWPIIHPNWKRDSSFHFSIGYPF